MMFEFNGPTKLLVDKEEMKVGCVILQSMCGGDRNIAMSINTNRWFTEPTKNMKLYTIQEDEIEDVINIFNNHGKEEKSGD